jgi:hypothetical protein
VAGQDPENPDVLDQDEKEEARIRAEWKEKELVDAKVRKRILRRLDVSERKLSRCPSFTAFFRECSLEIQKVIDVLRLSKEPDAVEFIKQYDRLKMGEEGVVPFEAFILAAKIEPRRGFLDLIIREFGARQQLIAQVTRPPAEAKKSSQRRRYPRRKIISLCHVPTSQIEQETGEGDGGESLFGEKEKTSKQTK